MTERSLRTDDCDQSAVERYSEMVYRLAYSYVRNRSDADDVYQEVFLRYLRKKPQFESEEHRKAWLLRVTINCCKKLWSASLWARTEPLEGEIAFAEEEENLLAEQLERLPSKYRAVLHLFYYEDMTVEEIGRALRRKPSTVRTQLTRGRRLLRGILEEDEDVSRALSAHE